MTERAEQQICIKCCVKLEHSPTETTGMIEKTTAVGNWWLAASSRQHAPLCITSHAQLFGETSNHPDDTFPLQPRFGTLWLLAFAKTKITFEIEEISDCWWDSGKYDVAADGDWENCARSQGDYFEGGWGIIVLCTVLLVSASINVSFSQYMAGYFLDRPHMCMSLCVWVYMCVSLCACMHGYTRMWMCIFPMCVCKCVSLHVHI